MGNFALRLDGRDVDRPGRRRTRGACRGELGERIREVFGFRCGLNRLHGLHRGRHGNGDDDDRRRRVRLCGADPAQFETGPLLLRQGCDDDRRGRFPHRRKLARL